MIELDVARHLAQLKSITLELAAEFRFPALFSLTGAKLAETVAFARAEWLAIDNPAPYRQLCLRTLRYLTVLETLRKGEPDFAFWRRAFDSNADAAVRHECVLACYGSAADGAWDLVRAAAGDRVGKVRAFALQITGSIVRIVAPRRAAGVAMLQYHLSHGNPWNRLGALMGFSIAGLRGDGLTMKLSHCARVEWDSTVRHMAIALLARLMEKSAFAAFATAFLRDAAEPLPASTQAVLFHFLSAVHPAEAQRLAAQAFCDAKPASALAAAVAQGMAAQVVMGIDAGVGEFTPRSDAV